MIQADAEKIIDFRKAKPLEYHWNLHLRWKLDYLSRRNQARIIENQLQQHLAVLDYALESNQFNHHWEGAGTLQNRLFNLTQPWLDVGPEDPQEIAAMLQEQYTAEFGDPNDPEYQAEIDRLIASWN
jgi:hypothetical protein